MGVYRYIYPLCVVRQTPPSMGFCSQEYWSGLPCPPPGDLLDPGIEPLSLTSPALAGRFFTTSTTWETLPIQVNCAIQEVLISNPFFFFLINSVNVSVPISQLIPSSRPVLVCSLLLCLYFCFANKIIYTIFLDSMLALIPLPIEVKLSLTSWKALSLLSYVFITLFFIKKKTRDKSNSSQHLLGAPESYTGLITTLVHYFSESSP